CATTMAVDRFTNHPEGGDTTCALSLVRPCSPSRLPRPSRFSSSRPPDGAFPDSSMVPRRASPLVRRGRLPRPCRRGRLEGRALSSGSRDGQDYGGGLGGVRGAST